MPHDLNWWLGRKGKKKKNKPVAQEKAFTEKVRKNLVTVPQVSVTQKPFEAPHHHQESMVDLTDDTSPSVPFSSASWKPVGIGDGSGDNVSQSKLQVTPTRQEKWLKFQESIESKLEKKNLELKLKNETNEQKKKEMQTSTKVGNEKEQKDSISLQQATSQKPENSNISTSTKETPASSQSKTSTRQHMNNSPKTNPLYNTDSRHLGHMPYVSVGKGVPRSFNMGVGGAIQPQDQTAIQFPAAMPEPPTPAAAHTAPTPDHGAEPGGTPPAGHATAASHTQTAGPSEGRMRKRKRSGRPRNGGSRRGLLRMPQYKRPLVRKSPIRRRVPRSFNMGVGGAIQPQDQTAQIPPAKTPTRETYMPPLFAPGHAALHVKITNTVQPNPMDIPKQYSPTDAYYDESALLEQDPEEGSECSDSTTQSGQKRLSAFQRLGPLTQPKKPKLKINLLCNKDESVREVVDETENEDKNKNKHVPVHSREDIIKSNDEVVKKYLPLWPWKKNVPVRKSVTVRNSKSVMMLEQEQMEETYDKDHAFIQLSVKGYPATWKKEDLLNVMLEHLRGKSFIPCFIEFTKEECKFLVIRSRQALVHIHKLGFVMKKDDVELNITIYKIDLGLTVLEFIPRLILRKILSSNYDGERKLSLKEFTLKFDISNFIYFPLQRVYNQNELVKLQSTVAWNYITDLDLSYNKITSIDGFEFEKTMPKLQNLDLSFNYLERVTTLLKCRGLSLHSLKLEGNPLCHDYIDPGHYIKVVRMMFPTLRELDGLPIQLRGEMPQFKKNYCPEDALELVEKFLQIYFPLLDSQIEERMRIADMYHEKAMLTVTYRDKLQHSPIYRYFRNLFLRARVIEEGHTESIDGASTIVKLICKWPSMLHDPHTFNVDVMHHSDCSTILRINGIVKLTAESLAEDEHLVAFTRCVLLVTKTGWEYKIMNEMLYWDQPTPECAEVAFKMATLQNPESKPLSLKLDSPPDEEFKRNLTTIFSKITNLDETQSERCLELKEWNLKIALEYYIKLVKLDNLSALTSEIYNPVNA